MTIKSPNPNRQNPTTGRIAGDSLGWDSRFGILLGFWVLDLEFLPSFSNRVIKTNDKPSLPSWTIKEVS